MPVSDAKNDSQSRISVAPVDTARITSDPAVPTPAVPQTTASSNLSTHLTPVPPTVQPSLPPGESSLQQVSTTPQQIPVAQPLDSHVLQPQIQSQAPIQTTLQSQTLTQPPSQSTQQIVQPQAQRQDAAQAFVSRTAQALAESQANIGAFLRTKSFTELTSLAKKMKGSFTDLTLKPVPFRTKPTEQVPVGSSVVSPDIIPPPTAEILKDIVALTEFTYKTLTACLENRSLHGVHAWLHAWIEKFDPAADIPPQVVPYACAIATFCFEFQVQATPVAWTPEAALLFIDKYFPFLQRKRAFALCDEWGFMDCVLALIARCRLSPILNEDEEVTRVNRLLEKGDVSSALGFLFDLDDTPLLLQFLPKLFSVNAKVFFVYFLF